uniref:Uncharacterized protein n=1 Tax=Lepeophtheirus salmonis TaxID=72036 RepID=A0A0K2U249_LEPSM
MRSDRIHTPRFLEGLQRSIKASLGTSLSRLGKNRVVSKQLVSKPVNEDLRYRSYRMAKQQILTASMKATRLTNGKGLLNDLKSHGGRMIFFSDEKNWTIDRSYNVQNNRWLAKEREYVPAVLTTKFPAPLRGSEMLSIPRKSSGLANPLGAGWRRWWLLREDMWNKFIF